MVSWNVLLTDPYLAEIYGEHGTRGERAAQSEACNSVTRHAGGH